MNPAFHRIRIAVAVLLAVGLGAHLHASAKDGENRKILEQEQEQKQEQEQDASAHSGLLIGIMGNKSLEEFELTRDRPLFTPARHPPLPPPPPPPPPPKVEKPPKVKAPKPPTPPTLRLVGIVMTEETKLALLLDKERKIQRLAPGDEFEGWSVVKVGASSVEMKSGDERSVYRMFETEEEAEGKYPFDNRKNRKRRRRRLRRNRR